MNQSSPTCIQINIFSHLPQQTIYKEEKKWWISVREREREREREYGKEYAISSFFVPTVKVK